MGRLVSNTENFVNRDLSWLNFNHRVLQEAENNTVPVTERVRFLGIFSNNLDEFFRVRVANIRRMALWGKRATGILHEDPNVLLDRIQEKVIDLQSRFDRAYKEVLIELKKENIYIVDEKKLTEDQLIFARSYFKQEVRQWLVPIILTNKLPFPELKDRSIYLAVKLYKKNEKGKAN